MDSSLSIINPFPSLLEGPGLLHQLICGPQHEATALEYTDSKGKQTCLSYSELHSQADKLAIRLLHELRRTSKERPGIVPLYISQCPSLYISILAVLKSGAAFCPLNLDAPEERLRFILEDTSATVVLTTSDLRSSLPDLRGMAVLSVDELCCTNDDLEDEELLPGMAHHHLSGSSLAYVMYTSGSTGLPKAVCLPHQAVTQSLLAHDRHIPLFSRFLQFASPTFDVSVFEIFFPWIRGCTLVACDRGRLLGDLPGMLTSLNIDAAELTPSVAASLVRKRENVPTLQTLLTIGEMLNIQVIQEFGGSERHPSMLFGMYGPTEAAIHCTIQPSFATDMPAGNIGIPLDTVSCFIVKPAESGEIAGSLDILPLGEAGELVIGGHQLALGYLNREEQTRAAFISHPEFGNLYRTGDRARIHPNGILECQGRISSGQVKLRGQRIELGEIEHAASRIPGCHAVVAIVIRGQLVVFCIVEPNSVTTDTIREGCRQWLPKFMIPSDVVLLGDFPYLPSGKVDKKTLEANYGSNITESDTASHNVSRRLGSVIGIMSRVLNTRVEPSADLGVIGLDSLKAIQVASELRREGLGTIGALDLLAARFVRDLEAVLDAEKLPTITITESTTLKRQILEDLRSGATTDAVGSKGIQNLQQIMPCTPLQDAMLSETAQNPQAYCNSFMLHLSHNTTKPPLRKYLHQLAERHPMLRSGFCVSNTSISSHSQLTWESLNDSQIVEADEYDHAFSVLDLSDLRRPLRIQYMQHSDHTNILVHIHHALYDQWSLEIFVEDLSALLLGRQIPPRPSFASVNEYFLDLKLSPTSRTDSMSFWQEYLSVASPGRLPRLNPESLPPVELAISRQTLSIDMSAVRTAARHHACSAHVFFQAAYGYLLSVYMGTADVTFGTVYSGRTLPIPDVENIFGPLLSTLPTWVDFSEARKFSDVLRRLHEDNRNIMQHASTSLADIKRVSSATPGQTLFDSIFVWQETARESPHGQNMVALHDARDYLEFNLTLEMEPCQDGVIAKATYQPSLLSAAMVETIMLQLEQIVGLITKKPDVLMEDLVQTMPSSLLSLVNPEPQNFIFTHGLGSVVERHAQETPQKIALRFAHDINDQDAKTEYLTYEELNTKANRLANLLISMGTLPDELVCICMDKSIDLYVGILAIVKTGAAYLPLVPETPSLRIAQILSDAKVKLCLVDKTTSDLISRIEVGRGINVNTTDCSVWPPSNPQVSFEPSHLAYAVFTSGTTGKPKGVLVTQENIMSNLAVLERIYPVPDGSVLLQACNQAFDVSVFEIFFAWFTGMCLCSATKDVLFRDLENAINQLGISHLSLTPTVAALVNPVNVPKVQFLVTAGEAVTQQVHQTWAGKGLYQGYGPSETTNICTVNPAASPIHAINNIGPPFENTSAFVLSNRAGFQPLPSGGLGELSFGGQQVFRGYQNMEELTASKIVEHVKYGRIYRSGDLGRMLPDGTILIEGRIDDQRKLRGQRIELGEIASLLLRLSSVQDCSIQIFGETKQQERLLAFWIPKDRYLHEYSILPPDDDLKMEIRGLFDSLLEALPPYMIPALLVPLSAFPRTSQGKIDRRKLASDVSQLQSTHKDCFSNIVEEIADTEGLSQTEIELMGALSDILLPAQPTISRTVSFFAMGLDSVSAIRFSRAIKDRLKIQVDVSVILRQSSIRRLAATIDGRTSGRMTVKIGQPASTNLVSKELTRTIMEDFRSHGKIVQTVLPCTPLQEAMLSASSADRAGSYYSRTVFSITGDLTRLRQCWKVMLDRHAILRTAFAATDNIKYPYLQVVLRDSHQPWSEQALGNESAQSLLGSVGSRESTAVVGLDPPYELKAFTSSENTYLLLTMHHAMYDGNAMSNLLHEVEEVYRGTVLPAASDFAPFLDHMRSTDVEAADNFFASHLQEYIPKPFRKAQENGSSQGFGKIETILPLSQVRIQDYVRKHTVSTLSVVQATWARVLSVSQQASDICFGNVVSGRSAPVDGVQSLVAPCFNTVPVRVDLARVRSNLALIKVLQEVNVESSPYQLAPLRRIQANAAVTGTRLFDSIVLLQQESMMLDGNIWDFCGEAGEMDFPCIVEVSPMKDAFNLTLHFDRNFFIGDEIPKKLSAAFAAAFSSCIIYPSSDVLDLVDFNLDSIAGTLKPNDQTECELRIAQRQASQGGQIQVSSVQEQWTPTELEIRHAFAAVSGTPANGISRDTTIYRIGIDSISAIQVAGRLRKQGISLTAADVLENPSCSLLASMVQNGTSSPTKSFQAFDFEAFDQRHRGLIITSLQLEPHEIAAVRPCTAVQGGMLSQYLQSDGETYLNHVFYDTETNYTPGEFADAWTLVVERHEMLRTGFVGTDDSLHPFAMLTYSSLASQAIRLQLEDQGYHELSFSERQQAVVNEIQKDLHFPPWRWDLFDHAGKKCLQLSAHHALFDAETLRLIQDDLQKALRGSAVPVRESIDGALNLIVASSLANKEAQQTFWSHQLEDLSITRFPNLHPVRVAEHGSVVLAATCKLTRSEIEAKCRALGVSVQAAGQAAWSRLLAAYTGENQVTFGVVSSGRATAESISSPFPCITTLPVTVTVDNTNEQLLHELMAYNAAIQQYQFTPLAEVQRFSGSPNEALFDTLFAYQRPISAVSQESTWRIVHENASVDYPISIEMESLPNDQIGFRLTIQPHQIPERQGHMIVQQLEALLYKVIGATNAVDSHHLSIVPAKDSFIPTEIKYLHEFVTGSITKYPERAALEFVSDIDNGQIESQQWTYQQLDQESNRIAQLLVSNGCNPDDVIGTSFDKCPEASFAFLGILKAGCAFCAIDPTAPTARKVFILEDSNATLMLTTTSIVSELKGLPDCKVIDLTDSKTLEAFSSEPVPSPRISPSSISYVLYTSGTTGTPKGCEITHENAVQALLAFQRLFEGRWDEHSRWLQFASFHFDVSVLEQFWTWSVGIRMIGAPRDLILEDIAGFLNALQITHLDLTPSLGRLLDPVTVPSLHQGVFITGGEALKQDMINSWGDIGCLYNFYGPTECTIGVTTFPSVPTQGKPSNIGWLFDNVGAYVLTPGTHEPVLRGAVGELCISGRLVGKGYLNRPELTADCFPHLEQFDERVYRTGDLVRLLHDESIDFLGRKDNQVKLRGQRLEIDEIEAVIRQCPEIQDVICLVTKHPKQQKDLLVAFIAMSSRRAQGDALLCPADSAQDLTRLARTACEDRLPGYMVPTHFVTIQHIPLSINNKVEEKKLRALYSSMSTSTIQEYAAQSQDRTPLNDREHSIARILSDLLQIDAVNLQRSSNIFALGLSSISAIQFSRKLKSQGFESAQVALVMRNATIGKLATALSSASKQDSGDIIAAKQFMAACRQRYTSVATRVLVGASGDIDDIVPCTPLQQGIISRSLNSESSLYFNTFQFKLIQVELPTLHQAFQTAMDNVQVLRVAFIETDDGYVQAIRKNLQLRWLHFEAPTEAALEERFHRSRDEWRSLNTPHLAAPFEVIVGTISTETFLEVHIHHAIYDGSAIQILFQKITQICMGDEVDFGKPFTEVLPYGPLKDVKGAKEFWMEHLVTAEQVHMPQLGEEATSDTLFSMPVEGLSGADSLRRSLNVTLQAVVQTAWVATLRKYYSGALGTVVSGRSLDFDGADSIIGPLFNTIPFNPDFDGEETWQTLVKRCHEFNVLALPFQHTPLRDIMKWCRNRSSDPLFDTLFVFQGLDPSTLGTEILIEQEEGEIRADYPLSFEVKEMKNGKLNITISAQSSICSRTRALQLCEEFTQALSVMVEVPGAKIGESLDFNFVKGTTLLPNRRQAHELNGVLDFHWSPEAEILRAEVASLACVEETDVDEHTSIFELGLDSVDAVKLSSRLKKKGLAVAVSALMRSQTIPKILSMLKSSSTASTAGIETYNSREVETKLVAYVTGQLAEDNDIEHILPASPMQEGLISEMIKSSYHSYFNHDVLEIGTKVDISKLERAWEIVINASPILRTGFLTVDAPDLDVTFAQIVRQPKPFRFSRLQLPRDDFGEVLQEMQASFSSGPLTAPHVLVTLATSPTKSYLVLSIAHALYDGHSLTLMHQDVHDAYHGQFSPRPFYKEVLTQASYDSAQSSNSFWRNLLTGATRTHMHVDSNVNEFAPTKTYRTELATPLSSDDITAFCRSQGVTVQALCQTAWSFVLAHHTSTFDVLYGVVLAGRNSQLAEQVMFPTMNTVVMRAVLHGTRLDMLQYVQGTISDIVEHQHVPLRNIQAACQKHVSFSGSTPSEALFNTLFTYQKRPSTSTNSSSEALYESVTGASDVDYPVAIEAEVLQDRLVWRSACKSNCLSVDQVEEMLQQLTTVISEIITHPESLSLDFVNQRVSVCGLPAIDRAVRDDEPSQQIIKSDEDQLEASTWSVQESTIRNIIAQVTRTPEDEITKHATIQNLGVDSINAIKISSLLRKSSIRISVSEIIRAGSVVKMVESLSKERPEESSARVSSSQVISNFLSRNNVTIKQFGYGLEDVEKLLPATAGQIYMLSAWQITQGQVFFPEFQYVVRGNVHFEEVRKAWDGMVKRHDILRTIFCTTEVPEIPFVQVIMRNTVNSCIDLDSGGSIDGANMSQPFASLAIKRVDDHLRLGLRLHHALYDAISLPLLVEDLEQQLQCRNRPTAQNSFSDFIIMGIHEGVPEQREKFWTRYLQDISKPSLPAQDASLDIGRVESFDPSVMAIHGEIDSVIRREGLSLQALFFAAYARIYAGLASLNQDSKRQDVVIGIYLANRSHLDDLSSQPTPTLNLVPLLIKAPRQTGLIESARQVQEDLQKISTPVNSSVGLWEIEKWTGLKIDTFVNFIKLPDASDAEKQQQQDSEEIYMEEDTNGRSTEKRSMLHKPNAAEFEQPERLKKNIVQDAYPRSLDIEATVADGALAIGVFGWENMIGVEAADKLIQDLKSVLEEALRTY